MLPASETLILQDRKQQLLVESDLNRQLVALEWQQVKTAATWVRPGARIAFALRPALWVAAPVAGFFLVRNWRLARGLWLKALLAWQLYQRIRKGWRFLSGRV